MLTMHRGLYGQTKRMGPQGQVPADPRPREYLALIVQEGLEGQTRRMERKPKPLPSELPKAINKENSTPSLKTSAPLIPKIFDLLVVQRGFHGQTPRMNEWNPKPKPWWTLEPENILSVSFPTGAALSWGTFDPNKLYLLVVRKNLERKTEPQALRQIAPRPPKILSAIFPMSFLSPHKENGAPSPNRKDTGNILSVVLQ